MNTQPQSPPWVVTADRLVCICGCCLANVYCTNLNVNNSLPGVCFGTALAACSHGQVVKFMAFKRSSMYQCVVCYRQMVLLFLCNRVCVCGHQGMNKQGKQHQKRKQWQTGSEREQHISTPTRCQQNKCIMVYVQCCSWIHQITFYDC